jgi:WD40 repeat protein
VRSAQAQEVTVLSWSNCSAVLAVGTVKGNLQLYFVKEHRKVPVAAKHTKRICAGSWALSENILALAAADKTVRMQPSQQAQSVSRNHYISSHSDGTADCCV